MGQGKSLRRGRRTRWPKPSRRRSPTRPPPRCSQPPASVQKRVSESILPLSCRHGIKKTGQTRFWPLSSGKNNQSILGCCLFAYPCTADMWNENVTYGQDECSDAALDSCRLFARDAPSVFERRDHKTLNGLLSEGEGQNLALTVMILPDF